MAELSQQTVLRVELTVPRYQDRRQHCRIKEREKLFITLCYYLYGALLSQRVKMLGNLHVKITLQKHLVSLFYHTIISFL